MLKLHTTLKNTFPDIFAQESKYVSTAGEYMCVDDQKVSFTFQEGPRGLVGVNGVLPTEVIEFMLQYFKILDTEVPSEYNKDTAHFLELAIKSQELRTVDRVSRGVEGTHHD